MRWLYLFFCFAACVISGLLGLTAGINMNPQSTVKFVPDWGSLGDWVAGVSALLTFLVACIAMNAWRVQERQRLILQWKADLVDYAWTLPYIKENLQWPADKDLIDKIAGKFYDCIKSYLLMIEYVEPEKQDYYKLIWSQVHDAHDAYIMKGATRTATKAAFVAAYLNKFL
ncbi:hypothetical protein [Pseudomonas atacamensis]|jgi:hypothetical protein|uniref:hypothetical protein n=1 Tax=Pseudomonas atacamensis TaxID=2565368 RepID=UPI00300F787F